MDAPRVIVPILMELFNPKSVVDVGCGLGTFLHAFRELGIHDVLGIDGEWVNSQLLLEHIPADKFMVADLEKPMSVGRRFEMAICLEVAEHLNKKSAKTLIETLTELSDVVVFSAAVPNQGGQNHINEQWPSYWEELFSEYGFLLFDIIRDRIWNSPNVYYWYKQNMFVFVKKGHEKIVEISNPVFPQINIVHPELFTSKSLQLEDALNNNIKLQTELSQIKAGNCSMKTYVKYFYRHLKRLLK